MAPEFENYDAATASATSMVWHRKVRSSQRTQTTIQSCYVSSANVTCRLQGIRDVYPGTEESGPKTIRVTPPAGAVTGWTLEPRFHAVHQDITGNTADVFSLFLRFHGIYK